MAATMDGLYDWDPANKILFLFSDLKRFFMSGFTTDIIAHQGIIVEGVDFIQKSFSMRTFSSRVREVLDRE